MKITKDKLFIAFAVYSGAWLCVALVQWGLLSLQAVTSSPLSEAPPFDLYNYGAVCGGIVILLCTPVVSRAPVLLTVLFTAFSLLFRLADYLFETIYKLTANPVFHDQYYVVSELPWRDIGGEAIGYAAGACLLISTSYLQRKFAPDAKSPLNAFLDWLQLDVGTLLHRVPRLASVKAFLRMFIIAVCCLAATQSLASVATQLLTAPFTAQMGAEPFSFISPTMQLVYGYGPTIVLLACFGHLAGRLVRQMQMRVSVAALGVATIFCFAQDFGTIVWAIQSLFIDLDNWEEVAPWVLGIFATIPTGFFSFYLGYSGRKLRKAAVNA